MIFKRVPMWPKKWIHSIVVLVKESLMRSSIHNQKYTNVLSMVLHANWHHPPIRQSEHTQYSNVTYQQQCIDNM